MNFIVMSILLLVLLVCVLALILKTLYQELGVVDQPNKLNQKHQYLPQSPELLLLVFAVSGLVVVYFFHVDFLVADWIYQHTQWFYKKSFIANDLLHKLPKMCLMAVYLYLLIKLINKFRVSGRSQEVFDMSIMLLAIILSVSVVTLLKRFLEVDCPWDLLAYGGDKPFFPLFNYNPAYLPSANCFPASHASVGFSWIAVYFYLSVNNHPLKYKALLAALVMGGLFGITQQLRGAHFISHDLTSLLICLVTSMSVYAIAYPSKESIRCAKPVIES